MIHDPVAKFQGISLAIRDPLAYNEYMQATKGLFVPMVLAFCIADVGKRSNSSPLHGGALMLRGFESHRRLQRKAPIEVAPSTGAVIRTAEAAQTRSLIIRLMAVELNSRFHSDLPQLPYRMP